MLILWYLIWGTAALYTIMTISIWTATLRTLGLASLRHCPRMLRLSSRASAVREMFVVILVPFVVVLIGNVYGPLGSFLERSPINAFLLMGGFCFTLFFVPPTVLVFSTSTNERLRWALALKRFAGGRRVISLLDTGYMRPKASVTDLWAITSRRSLGLTDVLRTNEAGNWQAVVQELIGLTPIVVVDTRVHTRALQFEAATMLAPQYAYKAIFVSEDDGSCPVLDQLLAERSISSDLRVTIVKEGELEQLLRDLVKSKRSLPRPRELAATPYAGPRFAESRRSAIVAPIVRDESSKRLSMALTPVFKLLGKMSVAHIFASLLLGAFVIAQDSEVVRLGFSRTAWVLVVVSSCACSALFCYLAHSLKEVHIVGDQLFISEYPRQSAVCLTQITHVEGPDWTTLRRITLHLRQPCEFGKRIVFAAGPLKGGMVARELRRRVYSSSTSTFKC